jgi:transposase
LAIPLWIGDCVTTASVTVEVCDLNHHLVDSEKGYCTQAALGASRTATFLGERFRRLSRRIGGVRAQCAVGRSILVIVWHLLSDPGARFLDLGPGWHERKTDRDRKIRSHFRQLKALGLDVTITSAA